MASTIREQIIGKIITRAAAITTVGGFNLNLGSNVYRAVTAIDPDNLPAINIWPDDETNERKYGQDNISMRVRIEGVAAHGSSNPSTVNELILGDLRKAFTLPSTKSATYSSLVDDVYYESCEMHKTKQSDKITGCAVSLVVKYYTLTGNPYAQS